MITPDDPAAPVQFEPDNLVATTATPAHETVPVAETAPAGGATASTASRASGRPSRILVGLLCRLSCLFVVASSPVVWTHQEALNTDRSVSVVGAVSRAPAVIATLSHRVAMKTLRDHSDVVGIQDGMVTLDLYALVGNALKILQSSGIIPALVTLPDLSSVQVPEQACQQLEQALGITLPADFGQIPLVKASALETARQAVQLLTSS